MSDHKSSISFRRLIDLTYLNVALITNNPSLYMICKKDNSGNNEVIFAGVASNLKQELAKHLEKASSCDLLSFCFSPTSAQNVLKHSKTPLYNRVA